VTQIVQRASLPPEPAPGSVITWQQQFTPQGLVYTFAAVHAAPRRWYVSNDSETPYAWPELFYWLIGTAPVFAAASWTELPG
jgi:hypothetical protein